MLLEIKGISVRIKDRIIVDDISFEVGEHDVCMVMGPNGAGKTTLFKAIMGVVPHKGKVLLDGVDIGTLKPRDLAKRIGVLSQKHQPQFAHTVYDVVSLGRYAYQSGIFGRLTEKDKEKIEEALVLTGIEDIRDQSVLTLSGGELQRTFLAQLFAQDPQILILDEPASHLDLQYQIAVFDLLAKWVREKRRAVIASVHDLNTVYSYGTKAVLINRGRIHAEGSVEKVLERENLKSVYNVDVAEWMKNLLKHWE
ncbi:MAG TPA: ABC transporter ATP-binding protein [Clostridiaceae bacterium]|nr:ABC transporter ATP-binding protein [Clostridiaceae bacterium]